MRNANQSVKDRETNLYIMPMAIKKKKKRGKQIKMFTSTTRWVIEHVTSEVLILKLYILLSF